jgi:hypothetical protein
MYWIMKSIYIRFKELGSLNSLIDAGKFFFLNNEYCFKNITELDYIIFEFLYIYTIIRAVFREGSTGYNFPRR